MSTNGTETRKTTRANLFADIGATGLQHSAGQIHEEFLRQLRGRLGQKAFQEMENNDPIVGAMLYAMEHLMRPVTWTVEPFDEQGDEDAEFVEEVFADMAHSMASFIGEWMAAPVYGNAPFEILWKHRNGYNRDPGKSSMFTDGKTGIDTLSIRHPTTLERWELDETSGRVLAMLQRAPPRFQSVTLPAEKMLFFTTHQRKGNPEGTSLLRRAYIPYYYKKRIENIEAIGIERELAGMPMFTTPADWWLESASDDDKAMLAEMKRIVRRLKTDEQNGIVMPVVYDDNGNQLTKFELVSSGGRRAIDTNKTKEYYSRHIAMTILADVILIGHEAVGSFSLASSKTNLFSAGLGSMLDDIEDVFNRDLIPRLLILNGRDPAKAPKLKHGDVETPNLEVLGDFLSSVAGAGMQLFPSEDGELERAVFRAANLPEGSADQAPELFAQRQEQREQMRENMAQATVLPGQDDDDEDDT